MERNEKHEEPIPFFSAGATGYTACRKEVIGNCTLYLGDCLEVLPHLQGIGAVISDPPYGMSLNTDSSRFSGGAAGHVAKRGNGIGTGCGKPILEDDQPFDPEPWMQFDKVVLFGCNHFAKRLPVGTIMVWIKRFDPAFGSFLSDAELAWMKGGHGVYCHRDLTMNREARRRVHPTQKPVSLMVWCMEMAKVQDDDVVLDPYMGSGTTGVACIKTGRHFIGIEKDRVNFDNAVNRIKKESAQLRLF